MLEFVVPYGSDFPFFLRQGLTLDLATGATTPLDGSATIAYRVQTAEAVDLPDYAWPETMDYIAGSDGDFIGVLRDTLPWTVNQTYRLIVEADAGPDQRRVWEIPVRVVKPQKVL
jgi:hypothetical protein